MIQGRNHARKITARYLKWKAFQNFEFDSCFGKNDTEEDFFAIYKSNKTKSALEPVYGDGTSWEAKLSNHDKNCFATPLKSEWKIFHDQT